MPQPNKRMCGPPGHQLRPDGSVFDIADSEEKRARVLDGAEPRCSREIRPGSGRTAPYTWTGEASGCS